MTSIYDFKPAFQALLRPLVRACARAGITANAVTCAAIALSLSAGAWMAVAPTSRGVLLALPVVLLVRMGLNAIDGMLAREHGMKSSLGVVVNEVGDVVSDAGLYLPFELVPGLTPWLVVLIVVLAVVSEMTGVVAVQIGARRRHDGPMGKSDRAFVFGLLALLLGLGLAPGAWSTALLAAISLLLAVTIVNRSRKALREVSR